MCACAAGKGTARPQPPGWYVEILPIADGRQLNCFAGALAHTVASAVHQLCSNQVRAHALVPCFVSLMQQYV